MSPRTLAVLRCPACGGKLQANTAGVDAESESGLRCGCGRTWELVEGILDFTFPDTLKASDAEFRSKYDRDAAKYDEGLDWLFASFGEDQTQVREAMVAQLGLRHGDTVLDLGCGTGADAQFMIHQIGEPGHLLALDLSPNMLQLAQQRLDRTCEMTFMVGNGAHLPLAENCVDAAFHFGGINEFGDIRRALSELTRVTKPGGKVVFGDEGVAPWLQSHRHGRILINANPLYRHQPPLDVLPPNASNVSLRWIIGNAFYLVEFTVGEPPFLDEELPIPGKGDSLLSRLSTANQSE